MANNFNIKSINELNRLAKEYKSNINKVITETIDKTTLYDYKIPKDSEEPFNNIVKFYLNSTVKDSELLDSKETEISKIFGSLLMKYYESGLNNADVYQLLYLAKHYNIQASDYLNNHLLTKIFELTDDKYLEGYFGSLKNAMFSTFNEAIYKSKTVFDTLAQKSEDLYFELDNNRFLFIKNKITKERVYYLGEIYADTDAQLLRFKKYLADDIKGPKFPAEKDFILKTDSNGTRIEIPYYEVNISFETINKKYTVYGTFSKNMESLIPNIDNTDYKVILYKKDNLVYVENDFKNIFKNVKKEELDNLNLKIENGEFLYKLKNSNIYEHSNYFIKNRFMNWTSFKLDSFVDMTSAPSYDMNNRTHNLNKFEFMNEISNTNILEFVIFIYLINTLRGVNDKGRLNSLEELNNIQNPQKNDLYYVYDQDKKEYIPYLYFENKWIMYYPKVNKPKYIIRKNIRNNTKTFKYVRVKNKKSKLYKSINPGANEEDLIYEPFDFSPSFDMIITEYFEDGKKLKSPNMVLNQTNYSAIESLASVEQEKSLYVYDEDIKKYIYYGYIEEYVKDFYDIDMVSIDNNNINDINKIETIFNPVINSFVKTFKRKTNISSYEDLFINSNMIKVDELQKQVLTESILKSYITRPDTPLNKDPIDYKNIMVGKSLIKYTITNDYSTDETEAKMIADMNEISNIQNNKLPCCFNLLNIKLTKEEFDKFTKEGLLSTTDTNPVYSFTNDDNSYFRFSLGMLYKELNPFYREVEQSDSVELLYQLLGENLFVKNNNRIINEFLDELIRTYNDTSVVSRELLDMVQSLYANPYIARKSRESDIIQYFSGKFINYGVSRTEKSEIALFLSIYQETRDVFYLKLLNKSFTQDDYYDAYEKYFLAVWSIERYLSSKIEYLHDIDYFDSNDIHNFLISYGLDILDKSDVFYRQDEYKKNIIRHFNELVRLKGSKEVIKKIVDIFSSSDVTIDIKKYLLGEINDYNSSSIFRNADIKKVEGVEDIVNPNSDISLSEYTRNISEYDVVINNDSYKEKEKFLFSDSINADKYFNKFLIRDDDSRINDNFDTVFLYNITSDANATPDYICMDKKFINSFNKYNDLKDFEIKNHDKLNTFLYHADIYGRVFIYSKYKNLIITYTYRNKTEIKKLKTISIPQNYNIPGDSKNITYTFDGTYINVSYSVYNELGEKLETLTIKELLKTSDNNISVSASEFKNDKYYCGTWSNVVKIEKNRSEIKFIEIPYESDNDSKEILNAIDLAEDYDLFLSNDKYWSPEETPAKDLLDLNINLTTTKYAVFDFSKNISEIYLKSRYALDLIDYLSEKLIYTINETGSIDPNDTQKLGNVITKISVEVFGIPGFNGSLSIDQLFTLAKFMYRCILKLTLNDVNKLYPDEKLKFYGINRNMNLDKMIDDPNYKLSEKFKNLKSTIFSKKVYKGDFNTPPVGRFTVIDPYVEDVKKPLAFSGFEDDEYYVKAPKLYDRELKYTKYAKDFASIFNEIQLEESSGIGLKSGEEMIEYFLGLNYISMINDDKYEVLNSDGNLTGDIVKTNNLAWKYYMSSLTDNSLITNALSLRDLTDSLEDIYVKIIEKIIQFPVDYITGLKNPDAFNQMCLNDNFIKTADYIFDNFYVTNTDAISLSDTLSLHEKEMFNKDMSTDFENLFKYATAELFILNDDGTISKTTDLEKLENPDNLIKLNENLIKLLEEIRSTFESEQLLQIVFSMSNNTMNLIKFILAAIEMFISYTTDIHDIRIKQSYDSKGEYCSPYDNVVISAKENKIDMLYTDDKLLIKKLNIFDDFKEGN